jgi:hypothetical protein
MHTSRILQIVRDRWAGWIASHAEAMEPLDHPSLRGMSPRELADLPLERWGCAEATAQTQSRSAGRSQAHH